MPISRRQLLQLLTSAGGASLLPACASSSSPQASSDWPIRDDFASLADAEDWGARWTCHGVANLRVRAGRAVLEAGSDIFPNDPRPVAFAIDSRVGDGVVRATLAEVGREAGVVARRTSPQTYYAAVLDTDLNQLRIVRRNGTAVDTLATSVVSPLARPLANAGSTATLELQVSGLNPTLLQARLIGADGIAYRAQASDDAAELQSAGEAGVFSRADTLLPDSNPVLPALGNLHLLPYSVQEGQAVIATPVGAQFIETIRRRSTAEFLRIEIESAEPSQRSAASVIAATTGAPIDGGVVLHVASDLDADVAIEIAGDESFASSTIVDAGHTDGFNAVVAEVRGLEPGAIKHWRPRLRRVDQERVGPSRSFRVLPAPGSASEVRFVYGACASQFNQIFDHIAARDFDLFAWQGDLNYPDTHGPFAQTMPGYAGIWRDFLANPRLAPVLAGRSFAGGRDDHDYGMQDSNAATLVPWGLAPWESLVNPRTYQRISAGQLDIFLLDQRRFKDDPTAPDSIDKSLLGAAQREWLLQGLATSPAPFKVICSPCTLAPAPGANARDGSWAAGFTAERDLVLAHIRDEMSGQAIFLTGDTHFTMLWDQDGLIEQRACPLDIPLPNDQSISNPTLELTFGNTPGVQYWSRQGHFSFVRAAVEQGVPVLDLELVREDGQTVSLRRFTGAI